MSAHQHRAEIPADMELRAAQLAERLRDAPSDDPLAAMYRTTPQWVVLTALELGLRDLERRLGGEEGLA